ncbi:MAG: DUF460 domain-containing protein [Methanocellales archaeon]|nr:DUF460 domain-containing protein [Methanocellales archaeon]
MQNGYLIVGIDPGTTTAVAILDIKGELVNLFSSRVVSISDVIEHIIEYGRPLIVASDVTPASNTVEKIKRAFNAVLFSPNESLPTNDKINLAKQFRYSNEHERDALAAALWAFRDCKNKFTHIEKKTPVDMDVDEVKALVIRGYSIDAAISQLSVPDKVEKVQKKEVKITDNQILELQETIHRQEKQISRLREYIEELQSQLVKKDDRIDELASLMDGIKIKDQRALRKTREIGRRDKDISRLKKELRKREDYISLLSTQIDQLKQFHTLDVLGERIPLKVISSFTKDSILETEAKYGLKKGDMVFIEDAGGGSHTTADLLISKGIRVVIIQNEMSYTAKKRFLDAGTPILSTKEVNIHRIADFAVVNPDILYLAIQKWQENTRKMRVNKMESLIREYKKKI